VQLNVVLFDITVQHCKSVCW